MISNPNPLIVSNEIVNDEVTISASGGMGALSYSLDGDIFQESNVFSNLSAGNYSAYVQDANGCVSTTDFQILFTSTKDVIENFAFEIQPNPTSHSFALRLLTQSSEEVELNIYDMVGQLLSHQNLGYSTVGFTQNIDVDHLSGGIYTIQIKSGNQMGSTRLVIIK